MRILVVDQEFLVAMEVERVLTEAFNCEVIIATARTYSEELESQRFDLVVLDTSLIEAETAARLQSSNTGLILTTLGGADEHEGINGWAGVPIISKPFIDGHLIDAVKKTARN